MSGNATLMFPPSRPVAATKTWEDVYDLVYQMYWVDDQTMEDTMNIMKREHNFSKT